VCVSDDPAGDYPNTRLVLQELCISDVTLDDCRHVQHVCWQVSQRAAHLAATGEPHNLPSHSPARRTPCATGGRFLTRLFDQYEEDFERVSVLKEGTPSTACELTMLSTSISCIIKQQLRLKYDVERS